MTYEVIPYLGGASLLGGFWAIYFDLFDGMGFMIGGILTILLYYMVKASRQVF